MKHPILTPRTGAIPMASRYLTKSALAAAFAAVAFTGYQAKADLADLLIPGTDIVHYSTDFADGVGWNADPNASYGGIQNGENVFQPLVAGNGDDVNIGHAVPVFNISDGPINIYYRVQVQVLATNSAFNQITVSLSGAGGINGNNGLFQFRIGPGTVSGAGTIYTWGVSDSATHATQASSPLNPYAPSITAFINYRLTLSQNLDSTYMIAGYVDANSTGNYVLYGTGTGNSLVASATGINAVVENGGGNFSGVGIFQANAAALATHADWYDAIAVTTAVPEPATASTIVLGGIVLALMVRASRSRRRA